MNHYQVLGVARTATKKQIEDAYDKLVVELHPDKHHGDKQAEERFKAVNLAYQTLSDSSKRALYDQEEFGSKPTHPPQPPHGRRTGPQTGSRPPERKERVPQTGGSLEDLMSGMIGGMPGAGIPFPGGKKPASGAGPSGAPAPQQEIRIPVSLEEAFQGGQKLHPVTWEGPCPTCRGTGSSQAGGGGLLPRTICTTCRGSGRKRQVEQVPVAIPRGAYEGLKIPVKRPAGASGQTQNLVLTVHLKEDARFEREGNDLTVDVVAPYTVLVLGGQLEVETLAGTKKLTLPAGTPSGKKLRLPGLGLPGYKDHPAGELYARVKVQIPKPGELSSEERRLLLELARLRKDPVSP